MLWVGRYLTQYPVTPASWYSHFPMLVSNEQNIAEVMGHHFQDYLLKTITSDLLAVPLPLLLAHSVLLTQMTPAAML